MSRIRARLIAAMAAVATAAALAGCGTTTIDAGRAQKFVAGAFKTPPKSVKCPDGVEAKAGGTVTCQVVTATGKRYDLVLHIVDSAGRVKFSPSDLRPVP